MKHARCRTTDGDSVALVAKWGYQTVLQSGSHMNVWSKKRNEYRKWGWRVVCNDHIYQACVAIDDCVSLYSGTVTPSSRPATVSRPRILARVGTGALNKRWPCCSNLPKLAALLAKVNLDRREKWSPYKYYCNKAYNLIQCLFLNRACL